MTTTAFPTTRGTRSTGISRLRAGLTLRVTAYLDERAALRAYRRQERQLSALGADERRDVMAIVRQG